MVVVFHGLITPGFHGLIFCAGGALKGLWDIVAGFRRLIRPHNLSRWFLSLYSKQINKPDRFYKIPDC